MIIAGLEKVSTIDYPGEICCVVFLWGCNFRCGFCYNSDLVTKKAEGGFSEEYILNFLSKRKGKLDAVCISGGEPLMSLDFDFLRKIKEMGFKIKIDTNGSFPLKLKEVVDAGLVDYIAMDVKGDKGSYKKIAGVDVDASVVEKSMKLIVDSGLDYEFRTTIVPGLHDDEKIRKLGKWVDRITKVRPKKYFLQGFKNSGEFIDEKYKLEKNVEEKYLKGLKKVAGEFFGEVGVRC